VRAVLALLAAVNPPAVAVALGPQKRALVLATAAAITWALAVAAAAGSEGVLDALDVTPETFRVAAAVVLGLVGARWLVLGARPIRAERRGEGWGELVVPFLIPVLVTPALAMVSISAGADHGTGVVALGAAVSLALAWAASGLGGGWPHWDAGVRFAGALAIAVALALAVDGIRAI
jgi:small neutral amino acid transporter SnatA (MarC family)